MFAISMKPHQIKAALQLPQFDTAAAQQTMSPIGRPPRRPSHLPGHGRLGAILLLLYHKNNQLHTVFGKRPDTLRHHPGQIAFPGGKQDPPETFAQTALRETHEELGLAPLNIHLLGQLTPVYIPPSDFTVHPFVGWYTAETPPPFRPSPHEISQVLEIPIAHLRQPQNRIRHGWQFPYFAIGTEKIWGGTAVILNEFLERLAAWEHQNPAEAKP